jgi:hypothetical protein
LGWFYFCGEIFRFINHYYSNYKGYNWCIQSTIIYYFI